MSSDGNGWDDGDGVRIPTGGTVLLRPGSETDPLSFASEWPGESNLLAVTVGRSMQAFMANWRATASRVPGEVGFVGVGETTRSAGHRTPSTGQLSGSGIRTVADPADIAAVERHVRTFLDGWRTRDERTVVVVDSVTALLEAAPNRAVVAFAANLATLVADADAVGFLTARPGESEQGAIERVRRACTDAVEATQEGWQLAEPGDSDEQATLSADELCSILADGRRRRILWYLDDRERTTVTELAAVLATRAGERARVAGSLAHTHLPKLSDAGVVAYDADTEVVEATDRIERLRPALDVVASWDRE